MIITAAKPSDAAEILALQYAAYASEARLYDDDAIPPLLQTLAEMRRDIASMLVLKVVDGDRIVGSVRAGTDGDVCHIGRLIVVPDRQRQGIGTWMMASVEAMVAENHAHVRVFELFTGQRSQGNLRLYARLGYRCVRERRVHDRLTMIYLQKDAGRHSGAPTLSAGITQPGASETMEINQATPADAQAIAALCAQVIRALAGGDPALALTMTESHAQLLNDIRTRTVLVAVEEGQVVATVRGHADGGTCYIDAPLFLPEYLGQGVLARLLSTIEAIHAQVIGFSLNTLAFSDAYVQAFLNLSYRRHAVLPGPGGLDKVFFRKANGADRCRD